MAFSGGKHSIACLLTLIEARIPPDRIELHHHDVDGQGPSSMDWPSTTTYCRAIAEAFDLPIYLLWKEGGFLREMLRDGQPTAPVRFDLPGGTIGTVGGRDPAGTRLRFPQVSANLNQHYCSAYLKIDVVAALIRAQRRFLHQRTLIVTGERARESKSRAAYATFERHRTDTRTGSRRPRYVDHWRPVHRLDEREVWNIIRRHGIVPAPPYRLGWSRLACLGCIFGGPDQWASLRAIAPEWFERIARYEDRLGCTIQRLCGIRVLADRGHPYAAAILQPQVARSGLSSRRSDPIRVRSQDWTLPAGAFAHGGGPT